jgi:hypothetical protein
LASNGAPTTFDIRKNGLVSVNEYVTLDGDTLRIHAEFAVGRHVRGSPPTNSTSSKSD